MLVSWVAARSCDNSGREQLVAALPAQLDAQGWDVQQGCNNSGREQLVAALPAQLDAQGWDVQQVGLGEGVAEWVEQQGCQGVRAPGFVTPAEVYTFFKEIHAMWVNMGEYADLAIYDVVDEILDMVKPKTATLITPEDLEEQRMVGWMWMVRTWLCLAALSLLLSAMPSINPAEQKENSSADLGHKPVDHSWSETPLAGHSHRRFR
ncbi:uncharacterized protein HaLaN_05498 [Haematococcus lacustris]|uniref:Uncharacterized protein n=1 Tax=Haematococcus lacustris TaxID=44745 RepID=A0A699YTV6_HAELA|nr:uncharacterized protein HaLaN_05498 [Haematococcus lacustris]